MHPRAITHNPSEYSNPDEFIPERHLQDNGEELKLKFGDINAIAAYGSGRRCVYQNF
jgi:cytochrome P450